MFGIGIVELLLLLLVVVAIPVALVVLVVVAVRLAGAARVPRGPEERRVGWVRVAGIVLGLLAALWLMVDRVPFSPGLGIELVLAPMFFGLVVLVAVGVTAVALCTFTVITAGADDLGRAGRALSGTCSACSSHCPPRPGSGRTSVSEPRLRVDPDDPTPPYEQVPRRGAGTRVADGVVATPEVVIDDLARDFLVRAAAIAVDPAAALEAVRRSHYGGGQSRPRGAP